jgi:hypothetical protein
MRIELLRSSPNASRTRRFEVVLKHTHEGLLRLINLAFNHLGGIEKKL